jgi:hypothetical protein
MKIMLMAAVARKMKKELATPRLAPTAYAKTLD